MADEKSDVVTERKSVITKTIRRTYNLGNYQSLDVSVSYTEEVMWPNPVPGDKEGTKKALEVRQNKSNGITNLLLKDFVQTRDDVFGKLEGKHGRSPVEPTVNDGIQKSKEADLAELDELDEVK